MARSGSPVPVRLYYERECNDAAWCWWCKSLSSWEPQEEGMMSTAVSFCLSKKPRFVCLGKSQTPEGDAG
jgi:hypothetical protein